MAWFGKNSESQPTVETKPVPQPVAMKVETQKSKPAAPRVKKAPVLTHQPPAAESDWAPATVKFVHRDFWYAFLTVQGAPKDVYIQGAVLVQNDLKQIKQDDKLQVRWGTTARGLEVADVRPA